MCQVGTVVAYWSLTQEVAELAKFESFYCNDIFLSLNSANSMKNNLGKTRMFGYLIVFYFVFYNVYYGDEQYLCKDMNSIWVVWRLHLKHIHRDRHYAT